MRVESSKRAAEWKTRYVRIVCAIQVVLEYFAFLIAIHSKNRQVQSTFVKFETLAKPASPVRCIPECKCPFLYYRRITIIHLKSKVRHKTHYAHYAAGRTF